LFTEQPLDFVGDAFADLVVLIDVLVVLGKDVVAVGKHIIPCLEFIDMQGHPFVLVHHGPKLQHLAGQFLASDL